MALGGSERLLWGRVTELMGRKTCPTSAEESTRAAAQPLSPHLDAAQAIVRDLDGHIRFWSAGAESLYGWTRQDAVGQVSHDLLKTVFPVPLNDIQNSLLRDGHWVGELQHCTRDGRLIFVVSNWSLQHDHAGQPNVVTEVNIDVSERHRRQQARQRLAAIVESSSDAIIAKDLDGKVTDWNLSAERIFGYSEAEMIDRPILVLFPPDRLDEEDLIMARITRGERVTQFETMRRHKDGHDIPVSVTVSPLRGAHGEIVGASKIVRDLSEQRERDRTLRNLEAELAHAQRLNELGQLISSLAHEVTQPLTAIRAYLGAVTRVLGDAGDTRVAQAIARARDEGERAQQIIGHLRAFARKSEPHRQPEDLEATIRQALSLALLDRSAPRPAVTVRCDPAAGRVLIDRIQIEQVLLNLIRNAVEAMAHSPRRLLTITASPLDTATTSVMVSDTGSGLAPDVRERLFRPFTTTKPDGMGIGLSVCRSIILGHGGSIQAEDNPGGGTVFRFTLLRAVEEGRSRPGGGAEDASG